MSEDRYFRERARIEQGHVKYRQMLVDGIVAGSELRDELIKRFTYAEFKQHEFPPRRNPVTPV